MAMDGITLAAVRSELEAALLGAKIEKIYQPEHDELLLHFRGGQRLLLSASPNNCRVQLTRVSRKNPMEPPMFCMLLRKHLTNGRILGIAQPGLDRALHISIQAEDELGETAVFTLIAEIMGKHSNIILIRADGSIIDAIKHVTPAISSVRNVMPSLPYFPPPAQHKQNPLEASADDIANALASGGRLDRLILDHFSGISPAFAAEISLRCAGAEDAHIDPTDSRRLMSTVQSAAQFFDDIRNARFSPTLVVDSYGAALSCLPFDSPRFSSEFKRPFASISEALDAFYALRDQNERIKQKSATLQRILSNNIDRCRKKLNIQQDILATADKLEQYRLFGELITANLYRLAKGSALAVVENYYEDELPSVAIPLDIALSPAENAQRYYKKYNKAKAAFDMASEQIAGIRAELDYLEGQLDNLSKCTVENELIEMREELIVEGYIRPDAGRKRAPKIAATSPMHFLSSEGIDIYVGKNNVQNDTLTLKFASADDIWLHTKEIPGSHVIIKSTAPVGNQTLLEAATLAAFYSKARSSAQVPVDYTPRKYVKKPSGAKPGMVIYTTNRTAYVTPTEDFVKRIKQV